MATEGDAFEELLDQLMPRLEDDDATSSASESSVERAPPTTKKPRQKPGPKPVQGRSATYKRVATYYKRKDEIQELQDEIEQLRTALQQAKDAAPMARLNASVSLHGQLSGTLEHNHLMVAGTESLLSNYKHATTTQEAASPLRTVIHLPTDLQQRADILSSMREAKLQETFRFMAERTKFLDLSVMQGQSEHFNLPRGEMMLTGFDVVHYDDGHSLREVYSALQAFMNQQEMSVSESLGILTVRESDEVEEFQFGQSRFHSVLPEGLEIESNTAMFSGFMDATETSPAFAVVSMNYIDQDDLFPSRLDRCGRKEVVGAFILTEIPTAKGNTVAMTRWWNIRVRPPSQAIAKPLKKAILERFQGWCDFMPNAMAEWLVAHPPSGQSTRRHEDISVV